MSTILHFKVFFTTRACACTIHTNKFPEKGLRLTIFLGSVNECQLFLSQIS